MTKKSALEKIESHEKLCRIMQKQAERLKVRFGSALVSESKDHEIVCIPGLKGRDSKEIRLSTLAGIIQARMEEIIELVQVEIRNSGYEKKIIGGIVVTGGGSQLKHLPQLFEFITSFVLNKLFAFKIFIYSSFL